MSILQTTSSLIASALLRYIDDRNIRFGLMARNLPPFDPKTVYDQFRVVLTGGRVRLALIGFTATNIFNDTLVATTVEQAVAWRNAPDIKAPIVVLLNPQIAPEKIHSLELFDSFADADLLRSICTQGAEVSTNHQKTIWEVLKRTDIMRSIPLVANQVAAYYDALQNNVPLGEAFPHLGLLPDPEIALHALNRDDLIKRLRGNHKQVQDLLSLDTIKYRALARAFESDKVAQHRQTFLYIQAYTQEPTFENLIKLRFEDVVSLFNAPQVPVSSPTSKSTPKTSDSISTPDEYIVEQILNSNLEQDPDLEDFVQSRTYRYRENPESDQGFSEIELEDLPTTVTANGQEFKFPFPSEKLKKHPLEDLMRIWVQTENWGGTIYGSPAIEQTAALVNIFNDAKALRFIPLRPLKGYDNDYDHPSLITLLQDLDGVMGIPDGQIESLADIFNKLYHQRAELAAYRTLFLYEPVTATTDSNIFKMIDNYIQLYDRLARRLWHIYPQAAELYHDTIEQAIVQFLALDTVIIDRPKNEGALLTTLHPLHLWKWVELAKQLRNSNEILSSFEKAVVINAAKNLPTQLNTFLLDSRMFRPTRHIDEPRLVFAGEISNLSSEDTVGIPFYEPLAHQAVTTDGLDQLENLFRNFLALYPPARLGLVITLIDPPMLLPILKSLSSLGIGSNNLMPILQGARVNVYRTDPQAIAYDLWTMEDNEVLTLFRQNPHWSFHIDLAKTDYTRISSSIKERGHITLLCEPSNGVVQQVFRASQEQSNPFVVPVQVVYDSIRDTARFVQSPMNGIFDAYMHVRNALTGELSRITVGAGYKAAIKESELEMLARTSQWLVIIDRPHSTLELSSIGQRLAWFSTGTRTLSVYTQDRDRWREHITDHLQSLPLKMNFDLIDQHLVNVLSILPDGLLSTLAAPSKEEDEATHTALRPNSVEKLLSIVTILHWYRQFNPSTILLNVNPEQFRDWFRNEKQPFSSKANYLLALWYKQENLYVDIIAFTTVSGALPALTEDQMHLNWLANFAKTLETLFASQSEHLLMTPLRRENFREALSAAVFAPSSYHFSTEEHTSRTNIKSVWTKVINNLFSLYNPIIRLRSIRVALYSTGKANIESLGVDLYKREVVTLFNTLVQTVSETNLPIKADLDSVDVLLPVIPGEQELVSVPQSTHAHLSEDKAKAGMQEPSSELRKSVDQQAERLRRALIDYDIAIASVDIERTQIGPRIIRYWVKLRPPAGRLAEVQKYAVDLARELSSKNIPLIDNIPGEQYIGIDLAREDPVIVSFAAALDELSTEQSDKLLIAMGLNPAGERIQSDLVRLPHMLVAGSTGSGKTMFLSTLIMSLVGRHSAANLELLLVDPKQTDFVIFGQLPHLREGRIYYDPSEATTALQLLTGSERDRRTALLQEARCPNILEYNRRHPGKSISWIVIVIDEFADIMLTLSRSERDIFERQIGRLAATGRSIGIHLVLATQRPTADVVTGTIKANIPARISFRLPSAVDSRTILDRVGAENLLGQGDMLALLNGEMQRLQGYYASYEDMGQLLNKVVRLG